MTSRRVKEDQNYWNFVFSVFFIVVLVGSLFFMRSMRGGYPMAVPPFDAFLMALATFRITRLIVYDKITRWFRELFADTREFSSTLGTGEEVIMVEVRPYGSGLRHTIYDLLQCPWCIGIWSALIVVVCYFVFPWSWTVIFFLALAGAGSLFQVVANAVGWHAENLKLDAQEKERDLRL